MSRIANCKRNSLQPKQAFSPFFGKRAILFVYLFYSKGFRLCMAAVPSLLLPQIGSQSQQLFTSLQV
jgi:hypothetical protein